jgi:hypothetical protein
VKAGEVPSDEQQDRWSEAHAAALKADAKYQELERRGAELRTKLEPLMPARLMHGYVWVFLRKPGVAAEANPAPPR